MIMGRKENIENWLNSISTKNIYNFTMCPCCKQLSLDNNFICDCGWENDGIVDENTYSICNKSTIKNFSMNTDRKFDRNI